MRFPQPLALLLCAALVGCSDADDLGRILDDGSIQGQRLDEHHHDEDCDEDHDHEHEDDCDEGHTEDESCEDHGAAETTESGAPTPALASLEPAPVTAAATQEVPAAQPVVEPAPPPPAVPVNAAPSAPTPAPPAPVAAPTTGRFERASYAWIDFDPLMDFEYPELVRLDGDVPPPELPAEVRALHGQRVAVEGFMSPLAFDAGGVKEFSLVQDPSLCCFGAVPEMNHWIHVVMPDKERTEFYSFDPVAVYGVLQVGEEYQDGYVVSLYRMVADRVEGDF